MKRLFLFWFAFMSTALAWAYSASENEPPAVARPGDALPRRAAESSEAGSIASPAAVLTLEQALTLALVRNPSLAAVSWDVRADEAEVIQAKLWPSPEFEFEAEGFGGNRELSGTDSLETTYALSQLIELGGKRARRVGVASLNRDLSKWEYWQARLDVIAEVRRRFIRLLAAREHLRLQEDHVAMAEEVLKVVREQVKAGKVSPVDETRARAELTRTRIERERLGSEWKVARLRMAAMWGSSEPGFEEVDGDLFTTSKVPTLDELTIRLPQTPELARWETEMNLRHAAIAFEKAGAVPDLVLSGGVRHENASDSTGFVLALSIPIPLFDRNTGAIRRARYRASQVEDARLAAEVEVRVALEAAYESALAARAESVAFRDEAVPAAEAAARAAEEAYGYGKLGYLDVLESRENLIQIRLKYLEALVDYHTTMIEIERIIGNAVHNNHGETESSPLEEKND